jgi:hypothetical protein
MKAHIRKREALQADDVFAWIVIASIIGSTSLAVYGSLLWYATHSWLF